MARHEIVAAFEQYVERYQLPVQYGVHVTCGRAAGRTRATACARKMLSGSAQRGDGTGLYQRPKRPAFSADLPAYITQLHSGQYRNPRPCRPGRCWWWAAGNRAARSPRSCTRAGGRSICAWAAPGAPRAATVARTSTSGWGLSGFLDAHGGQAALLQSQIRGQPA